MRIGQDFKARIKSEIDVASISIALVTPSFYQSTFCMCELGAIWASEKTFFPIVVPPIVVSDLRAVANGLQAIDVSTSNHLDKLRDEILEKIEVAGHTTGRWNDEKSHVLEILPLIYRQFTQERQRGTYLLDSCAAGVAAGLSQWLTQNIGDSATQPWILLFDIDRQKQVNARHGVQIGSKVLSATLSLFDGHSKDFFLHGQCGDDTYFCLIVGTHAYAKESADRFLNDITRLPFELGIENLWLTASAGYGHYVEGQSIADWKSRLAHSIEEARRKGGNISVCAHDRPVGNETWS